MKEVPFYTLEHGGKTYGFKRPSVDQLNRFLARVARAPLSSALEFTRELSEDPEAWAAATHEKPGLALQAANGLMEALGFPTA